MASKNKYRKLNSGQRGEDTEKESCTARGDTESLEKTCFPRDGHSE